jgi:hypothetical protein
MNDSEDAYTALIGQAEGKIPRGWHRHLWEDNIKMEFKEID